MSLFRVELRGNDLEEKGRRWILFVSLSTFHPMFNNKGHLKGGDGENGSVVSESRKPTPTYISLCTLKKVPIFHLLTFYSISYSMFLMRNLLQML